MSEILVRSTRGMIVENLYRGSVVMLGKDGRVKAYCGDSRRIAYMRSAAKPMLATAIVECGAAEAFGLLNAELAVACGSHIGSPGQVEAVSNILYRIGMEEQDLVLGPALSLDTKLREQRLAAHEQPRKIYHNCSGKHSGMLAICRHLGFDTANYHLPEHPVQQYLLERVADFCELDAGDIILGIDGCSVPVHGMPLYNMALGYYNLCHSGQLTGERQKAAGRVLDAMSAEPAMVAATGSFYTELIRITKGRIIIKPGADGVCCAAGRDEGWALAVKMESGNNAVIPAVIIRAFRQMNILSEEEHQALRHFAVREIKTARGEVVGYTKAAFHMELL